MAFYNILWLELKLFWNKKAIDLSFGTETGNSNCRNLSVRNNFFSCSLKILFKFAERIFGINNCYFNFLNSICINNSTCRSSCSAWSATKVPFFFLLKRLRLLLTSLGSLELCRNEFLSLLSIYYKKKLEQSQTVCLYFREKNRTQADVIIVIPIRFFFDFLYLTIWWWEPKVEQTRTESGSQFLNFIFLMRTTT